MLLKDGVNLSGISYPMLLALAEAEFLWLTRGSRPEGVTITSANDGVHMENSLHFSGNAVDLRSRYFSEAGKRDIASNLQVILGEDYDVVVETDHIHVEYDPITFN